ncbi:hypothetical protein GTA51_00130 [Desulfovibrio aerotolerans]|uniref:Uncharacterized protein n=1 Tax=Solidesulfovibrio aerotolerans TaxID=295255 RepID=A0A7C9IJJ2_9BACT|nr:hypothetical protein [Solidesulfovibrio aerotolerans]MYL81546.1 hypothetical protein [Solidesulfovibrio aerotolerans]
MSSAPPAAVDIMDALLRATDETPYPGHEGLERLIRRAAVPGPAPKAAPVPTPEAAAIRPILRPVPPKAKRPSKRKATHYIEVGAAIRLDAARDALAEMARDSAPTARRISKSAILEAALTLACDAFEATGPQSPLARRLLGQPGQSAPKTPA